MNIQTIIDKSSHFNQKDKDLIKKNGVVFTDNKICNNIIERLNPKIQNTICEPSVGKGSFIFALLEFFRINHSLNELINFTENNLYCYDINKGFIDDFKILLQEYFKELGYDKKLNLDNIICGDFLLSNKKYDMIIGNPPYIRIQNMDKDYLEILKSNLKSITLGNVDMYYAFLEKALISSDKLGFIIPNSFIKNKSGKFIRDIIKDRVNYIYNFEDKKVWDNISTYTSIVICYPNKSDILAYETSKQILKIKKEFLSSDIWVFDYTNKGNNNLYNYINQSNGGIATLRDQVYKIDSYDNEYCYKNGYKIEKEICSKYLKGTKDRTYSDYKYIIYPYKDGLIIGENELSEKYPLCYKYLLDIKKELLLRDKGKTDKYDSWYAYGRKQGLRKEKNGKRIILPLTFLRSRGIHIIDIPEYDSDFLVLSGIMVDVKEDKYKDFINIITSNDFYDYCEANNKILTDKNNSDDKWLCITSNTLKKYMY